MNTVGSVVTASVVAAVLWQAGSLSDGSAGLTLSYATQFTQVSHTVVGEYTPTTSYHFLSLPITSCCSWHLLLVVGRSKYTQQ